MYLPKTIRYLSIYLTKQKTLNYEKNTTIKYLGIYAKLHFL